jgi:hypothetical protein
MGFPAGVRGTGPADGAVSRASDSPSTGAVEVSSRPVSFPASTDTAGGEAGGFAAQATAPAPPRIAITSAPPSTSDRRDWRSTPTRRVERSRSDRSWFMFGWGDEPRIGETAAVGIPSAQGV